MTRTFTATWAAFAFLTYTAVQVGAFHLIRAHRHFRVPPQINLQVVSEGLERNSNHEKALRRQSWIVTGLASFVVTAASLPSTWRFVASGFDIGAIGKREYFDDYVMLFFLSYLLT